MNTRQTLSLLPVSMTLGVTAADAAAPAPAPLAVRACPAAGLGVALEIGAQVNKREMTRRGGAPAIRPAQPLHSTRSHP